MTDTEPHDDRLTGHDDPDHVTQWGEIAAEELAEEHYPECYDIHPCKGCIQDTPLEEEREAWAGYFAELKALADDAEREVAKLDATDAEAREWIYGAYYDAFLAAAVDPAECPICPVGE